MTHTASTRKCTVGLKPNGIMSIEFNSDEKINYSDFKEINEVVTLIG